MSTRPSHEVYVVVDPASTNTDAKARWTKIGVGFFKNDGMTLLLDAVPLHARLVVRPTKQNNLLKGGPK